LKDEIKSFIDNEIKNLNRKELIDLKIAEHIRTHYNNVLHPTLNIADKLPKRTKKYCKTRK